MNNKKNSIIQFFIVIAAVLAVNFLAGLYFTRFDFTKEKRYTLSNGTKDILANLDHEVVVNVYLDGDFPANFKHLKNSTCEMLDEMKAYANGNLSYNFIDPFIGSTSEQQNALLDKLTKAGLQPTNLMVKTEQVKTQKLIVPGALVNLNGKQLPVQLLQNQSKWGAGSQEEVINASIENMEYQFASTIKKLSEKNKPLVGFLLGHGELNDRELADIGHTLSQSYELRRVDMNVVKLADLIKFKTVVIAKPSMHFEEAEKYKLDQFLMHGGRLLWLIDQVNAETDSIRNRGSALAYPKELNLDDQLFRYGVRINYDLLQDAYSARIPVMIGSGQQAQQELLPWVYYPLLMAQTNNPIVRNLDPVRTQFVNSIDTIANKGIHKEVLLSTSPYTRKIAAPTMLSLSIIEDESDPKKFNAGPQAVAVVLEGKFKSVFAGRTIEGVDQSVPFSQGEQESRMIVISDGDIIRNEISALDKTVFPLGFDKYTQQTFGNKLFVENCIDYLTDDSGLLTLRTKEVKIRLLDKQRIITEKIKWQLINTLMPVLAIILFGILHHYYRRKKYSK
ncbi:gliding motility-associated ABC transporter substrate-binding protein GldG [Solitalea koreensis]|uniref:Gliding-associated putative ABC transporter substrate-binding component GldG n=1 Tax=Solitalea koreensis TaxID=543615 RepID=A0A521DTU7_9SPHI|nr:gliding motility-associated ABC transporter substrate-binding protein GldG [Solitalea koreensis]SMO75002.1 gliding-associated putative ABC transporter substrate-binding component GldG [Solitalea koreensis]